VFTETDLRAAHVVARRIASVLKKVMLTANARGANSGASSGAGTGAEPAVTLATLKPSDNIETLIARVVEERPSRRDFNRLSRAKSPSS